MIYIKGGSFIMGDIFGDGRENERPVHRVTLDGFYMAKYAVTVGEFRAFVEETGYRTCSENPENLQEQQELFEKMRAGNLGRNEMRELYGRLISFGGTFCWKTDQPGWDVGPGVYWEKPGFEQTDDHPVVCLSWDDAIHYCNWLSRKARVAIAYDVETGDLLDENGQATLDTTRVQGYRLPTEAEWEYAARERGQDVRFGNGKHIARSTEINFRADSGDYLYLELGEYRKKTTPVGSFEPNSLGLYDMSGNAWEWVSDLYNRYTSKDQINPYIVNGAQRILRGGRWGGDAFEARVCARGDYTRNDRCNNSGFRIARSKKMPLNPHSHAQYGKSLR